MTAARQGVLSDARLAEIAGHEGRDNTALVDALETLPTPLSIAVFRCTRDRHDLLVHIRALQAKSPTP